LTKTEQQQQQTAGLDDDPRLAIREVPAAAGNLSDATHEEGQTDHDAA
jgi:hypothetical protein